MKTVMHFALYSLVAGGLIFGQATFAAENNTAGHKLIVVNNSSTTLGMRQVSREGGAPSATFMTGAKPASLPLN